ncbi:MAG: ATP-binding protein [Dehalococcoidia bacterium]
MLLRPEEIPELTDVGNPAPAGGPPPATDGPADHREENIVLSHSIETAKRIASKVAHDFNNVLTVVQGYAFLLQNRTQLDGSSRELAELIETAGNEAIHITTRLAWFANSMLATECSVDLNQLIEEFIYQSRDQIPSDIEVATDLPEGLPEVFAEEPELEQIFQQVLRNSLEAMPQGGSLVWRTDLVMLPTKNSADSDSTLQRPFLRLQMQDTGTGMDEPTRQSMFEPFFTTKAGKIRGLGATYVYDRVRSLGGFVEVASSLGRGTRVDLFFPVVE